jgi:DNA primase|tara:strand:- start:6887 stop:8623 length:1737 start_codon:yes stop_codon:yes gene_type:complete
LKEAVGGTNIVSMISPVDQIKERLTIVDVVSSYIKLIKAGRNFKARSPFSNEKTPSFFVSPDRDMYYCFSTSQGGDIFTFTEKMEGVDFKGALKILADRAGVDLVYEGSTRRDEKEVLYKILDDATRHFEDNLKRRKDVRDYMKERGVSERTMKIFRIGYALDEWQNLHEYLVGKRYKESDIESVGLLKQAENNKRKYDAFRGRIIFPIRDNAGRIVAFSGRVFEGGEGMGKYINSPETALYHKSRILFGYDFAKSTIRKHDFSIVVEGQMDVLMAHQAGFTNTVAVSGTSLTEEQLKLLNRLSRNIVLAFDSDDAGVSSVKRSSELALSLGMDVKVATMKKGKDPADLIKESKEKWRKTIKESKHIIEFLLDLLEEEKLDSRSFRKKVSEEVLPFVARITSKIDQGHFIEMVSKRINIPEDTVREEVSRIKIDTTEISEPKRPVSQNRGTRRDKIERRLLGIINWQESLKKPLIDTEGLRKSFSRVVGKTRLSELEESTQTNEDAFRAEIVHRNGTIDEDIKELINALSVENEKSKLSRITEDLKRAESEGDGKKAKELLEKSKKLSEAIAKLSINE